MTTSFNAAWVRLGSTAYLVVAVRPRIFDDAYEGDLVRIALEFRYRVPVVLMAQDADARARYRGRPALVAALRRTSVTALPWRRFRPDGEI